jgi:Immunoglobulin V-set domain
MHCSPLHITQSIIGFVSVLRVDGGVLWPNVVSYETETVQLSCHTDSIEKVEWRVNSKLHREVTRNSGHRRIYNSAGIQKAFKLTGRYHVHSDSATGFYNLTISNVNVSETGEYVCHERLGDGPKSSIYLQVLGKTFVLWCLQIVSYLIC